MTKEEAIKLFEEMESKEMYWQLQELCDLAIEALSADAVSREHHDMEIKELKHQIKDQAEMVSVVRCKDCRWQEECSQVVVLHKFCGVYQEISFCSHGERAEQTEYKLPGRDEVMEALDNMKLEFTINGTERVKRMAGDDHE